MNAITLTGAASVAVSISPDATQHRDQTLAGFPVSTITTPAELTQIKAAIQVLKAMARDVENTRVAIKAEPLRITREIDDHAKGFTAPILTRIRELEDAANAYARQQAEEQRKREEEARKIREAEEKRIRDEARAKADAEAKARAEAEAQRKAQDVDKPETHVNPFAAVREAIEREQAVEKAQEEVEVKVAQAVAAITVAAPAVATRTVWRWIVTDALAFANAHPELVTITPKARELNALVNGGAREIKGVKIYSETEAKL